MPYSNFWSSESGLGVPVYSSKNATIGSTTHTRDYYFSHSVSTKASCGGAYAAVSDIASPYDHASTYNSGSEIQASGVRFVCAIDGTVGVDPFTDDGVHWVVDGYIDELKPFCGSPLDHLENDHGIKTKIETDDGGVFSDYDRDFFVMFDGVTAGRATVTINKTDGLTPSVHESFTIDMRYRRKLFLKFQKEDIGGTHWTESIEIEFESMSCAYSPTGSYPNMQKAEIGAMSSGYWYPFAVPLTGQKKGRSPEKKIVLSDGVKKYMYSATFDTWSGEFLVEEADFMETEFLLDTATGGPFVFHMGIKKEVYDQRVFLGELKYTSPIDDNGQKYKFLISGEALSYGTENRLIAPDSTDGAAI